MNTYELINDFYAGIDDADIFEYTEDEIKVYSSEDSEEFEEYNLVKYIYEDKEYYFTTKFTKVKYSSEKDRYYEIETNLPYKVEFIFPQKSLNSISLTPKLNLEYDEIHDLIIRQALQVAIQYIQNNYINFCYDEIEDLKKKMTSIMRIISRPDTSVASLKEENEMLKKRITKIERKMDPSGLDSFVNKNQSVI